MGPLQSQQKIAEHAGIGMAVGAVIGMVIGIFMSLERVGISLIFGALAGIVFGPAIGFMTSNKPED